MNSRGTCFAWWPVEVCELLPLPNGNSQWYSRGWVWLRRVCWVRHYITGDVTYYLPNETALAQPERKGGRNEK